MKRALVLCRSLLKNCRDTPDQDHFLLIQQIISPAIDSQDFDLQVLALGCIGLVSIIDQNSFKLYARVFLDMLKNKHSGTTEANLLLA